MMNNKENSVENRQLEQATRALASLSIEGVFIPREILKDWLETTFDLPEDSRNMLIEIFGRKEEKK